MSGAQVSPGERICVGSSCHCYRLPFLPDQPWAPYVLVSHVDQEVLAQLTWEVRTRRSVRLTKPGSCWNATALSEAARWMHQLSRQGLDVQLRTLGHLLVAVALPWVLLSQVVVQPCDQRGCVPPDELPLQSQRELGRYARHEICEAVREALAQVWAQLEAEADQDRTAPPQGGETRVVTTFVCERDAGTPPEASR